MAKKTRKKVARKGMDYNALGERGESAAYMLLTQFGGQLEPLFRPSFLGAKWPTVDFVVEVSGDIDFRPYFLLQVKTSSKPPDAVKKRLEIKVSAADVKQLLAIPAPTYVMGLADVHKKHARGYMRAVCSVGGISYVPLNRRITYDTLLRLRDEVVAFWKIHGRKPASSYFEVTP